MVLLVLNNDWADTTVDWSTRPVNSTVDTGRTDMNYLPQIAADIKRGGLSRKDKHVILRFTVE